MRGDTFAALPPVPVTLVIAGERLELTPLKVGDVPAFARAVQPVAASLSASPDWLALLAEHGEAVIDAVAIASRRPPEWVSGLGTRRCRASGGSGIRGECRFFYPARAAEPDRRRRRG